MKLSSLAAFALGAFFGFNAYNNAIVENTENSLDIGVYQDRIECEKEEKGRCKTAAINMYVAESNLNK